MAFNVKATQQVRESPGQEGGPSTPAGLPRWGPRLAPALECYDLVPRSLGPRCRITKGEQVINSAYNQPALADRRRGHHHFANRIGREQLIFRPGFHNEHVTVFARQINPAGRCNRRRCKSAALATKSLLINSLACFRVVGVSTP